MGRLVKTSESQYTRRHRENSARGPTRCDQKVRGREAVFLVVCTDNSVILHFQ